MGNPHGLRLRKVFRILRHPGVHRGGLISRTYVLDGDIDLFGGHELHIGDLEYWVLFAFASAPPRRARNAPIATPEPAMARLVIFCINTLPIVESITSEGRGARTYFVNTGVGGWVARMLHQGKSVAATTTAEVASRGTRSNPPGGNPEDHTPGINSAG
ncbi:hypothetical protein GCM10027088_39570 [Nocardia goodfellowii]